MSKIQFNLYAEQRFVLPKDGKHFVANRNGDDILTLYQAYKKGIAIPAVQEQCLAASPEFKTSRMTWAKPGFLWMMYRSGWATKRDQEHILAFHVRANWLFAALKSDAVISSTRDTKNKGVVVQWDPDHDWDGKNLSRKAIQIGMRGRIAEEFAAGVSGPAVVCIEDFTSFVENMRDNVVSLGREMVEERLLIPREEIWPLGDELRGILGMAEPTQLSEASS